MSSKQAHLEMIQGVINRLSTNSFLLKGWTVILVSALLALAINDQNQLFIYLAGFPSVAFWCLDAYFLWQERLFRVLYDHVRIIADKEINYSMDTSKVATEAITWHSAFFSKTLLIFHGIIVSLVVLGMISTVQ